MTKAELKRNVTKIKKFLKKRDYEEIDTGVELARGLGEVVRPQQQRLGAVAVATKIITLSPT